MTLRRRSLALLIALLALPLITGDLRARATITVCASGCTNTNANLQTAIDNAVAGDTILLQEGFTYVGDFTWPVKAGAGPSAITIIRTGVNSTGTIQPTTNYPAANIRICPSGYVQDWYDCTTRAPQDMTKIAKITPATNNTPALRTVDTGSGTPVSYYKTQWVEFVANTYGGNALIVISNDTNNMDTGSAALTPHHFTFDQIVVRGLPVTGQFRGMQIEGVAIDVTNSFFYDIKAQAEGQAIWMNGKCAPCTIINNYMSGGTETFFIGGSSTRPSPLLTVAASPAPTTTQVGVTGTQTDLWVEKQVAVFTGTKTVATLSAANDSVVVTSTAHNFQAGWEVDFNSATGCTSTDGDINTSYPYIKSITDATTFVIEHDCDTTGSGGTVTPRFSSEITNIAGAVLTLSPALPITPVAGDLIRTGIVTQDLTVRYNVFTHPSDWFTTPRIVPLPTGTTATPFTTGGTLAAGTYAYRVLARYPTSQNVIADSGAAAEVSATTTGSTGRVVISWSAVANATEYYVYGRTPGGQTMRWAVTAPTVTYTDTGTAGTVSSVDTSATRWGLKNVYEMKMCKNCLIEYNIIERAWTQGQTGPCLLLTPTTQGNTQFSSTMRDITIRYNEIRHCGQAMQITGTDARPTESSRSGRISITNNLFWDIAGDYNGASPGVIWSAGGGPRQNGARSPFSVTWDHNTMAMDTSNDYNFALYFAACHRELPATVGSPSPDTVITNNIWYNGGFGLASENPAQDCTWNTGRLVGSELTGTSSFTYNVIAGATNCSLYTDDGTGNVCPTVADLEANTFTGPINVNRLNYVVKPTSPFYQTAAGGTTYGADLAAINTAMVITESGNNSGGGGPPPLTITTPSPLPTGQTGVDYPPVIITATGGTTPYTCAHTVGTMPTGLTFDVPTCTLSGIPNTPVTNRSLTFQFTDNASQKASKVLVLTIQKANPRSDRYNFSEGAFFVRAVAPVNPDDQVRVGDLWFDKATSLVKKAMDIGPPILWEAVEHDPAGSGGTGITLPVSVTLRSDGTDFSATAASMAGSSFQEITSSGFFRVKLDLTNATEMRVHTSQTALAVTGRVLIQYSTNNGGSWTSSGIYVQLATANNTYATGAWTAIPAGMKGDVLLRSGFTNGDGTESPDVSNIYVEYRR
jgi:hypothetical protein